eukprot:CAMPEP_0176225604 /NCGR_PEP_ID=MMETSP0121_2-20121125/21842_1 /TAXON_ID=160619 /ORGANISM="Kryptoperidinium foliaceum, Strain CCMP 1326" /LENGTH=121 /DNA_ID=CAMNT_0017564867 /DNA_START=53 /DNA_END=418 /DNA_ORIENTATION=+
MPTIDEAGKVSFDTVAREWRCKWSPEGGKASLTKIQALLEKYSEQLKSIPQVKKVQRVVCGGCLDFKISIAMPAAAFPDWEARKFEPEEEFLAALQEIDGVSMIETQTYTLMDVPLSRSML